MMKPNPSWGARRSWLAKAAAWATMLIGGATHAQAAVTQEVFAPALARGPVVIVASGNSGPEPYREFASNLAVQGYYVVLIDGKDVSIRPNDPSGRDGAANLRSVLSDAQAAPKAAPGKAALIGLSIGGIGILGFGAPLSEQVSAVVLFYPALSFVGPDLQPMSAAMKVPVLVFAGARDTFSGCCSIETMKAFEAAPRSVPLELVVYQEAGHAFNLKTPPAPLVYRPGDADDAWRRTLAFLAKYQPVAKP